MYVSGGKKCLFFGKFCVRTKWMNPYEWFLSRGLHNNMMKHCKQCVKICCLTYGLIFFIIIFCKYFFKIFFTCFIHVLQKYPTKFFYKGPKMNNLKYNISCHCHLFRFSQYSAAINTKYRKAFGKKWDVGTQMG